MDKYKVAERMAYSLLRQAKLRHIDLSGLTIENFNDYLDDAFGDGGEIRCLRFLDLSDSYSTRFGPFESTEQMDAQWECIELAIDKFHEIRKE